MQVCQGEPQEAPVPSADRGQREFALLATDRGSYRPTVTTVVSVEGWRRSVAHLKDIRAAILSSTSPAALAAATEPPFQTENNEAEKRRHKALL